MGHLSRLGNGAALFWNVPKLFDILCPVYPAKGI